MNKKGTLQLGINAIVIIILAMTLLGLGLGFIRGIFEDFSKIQTAAFEKIAEQVDSDLATSDAPLIFSSTRLTMDRGDSALAGLGVKNERDWGLNYGIRFSTFNCPAGWKTPEGVCRDTQGWFEYFRGNQQYEVKAADRQVNKVIINVPKNAKTGLYLLKIQAYEGVWGSEGCPNDYEITLNPTGCTSIGTTELFLTVS